MLFKKFLTVFLAIIIFVAPEICLAEELIIFHTNDMHSRILKGDDEGRSIGLAEIAGAVKAVKKKNPATFWFDAGDTLHGMSRVNLSHGENIIPLLNQAGVDIFVPGNHDFDYSSEKLERLVKNLKATTLSANIVRKNNSSEKLFQPYKIFELGDGTKVGVFGLTTPETAYKANPRDVADVEFLDPIEVSKKIVPELRSKCDILICVMHMGIDESSEMTSERIAREVSGIDLIIDGYSHTELPEGLQVGETLIAQTGCYEHFLGRVTIDIKDKKIISKKAELLNATEVEKISPLPDKKIAKSINKIDKHLQKYLNEVVGTSDNILNGERSSVRREETNLGNLCADSFRWKANADVGFLDGGNIKTSMPAGNITRGDILSVQPFQNYLLKLEISGKTLREVLEFSVKDYPAISNVFPHASGVTFAFDCRKPVGQRITDILVNGETLDENKNYTMAVTDFLLNGGDGFTMFKNSKVLEKFDVAHLILTEYINKVGIKNIEVGRIKNLNFVPLSE